MTNNDFQFIESPRHQPSPTDQRKRTVTVFHPIRQFVNSPNGMRVNMSLSSYQRWNYRVNNRFCVWVQGSGASLAGCSLSQKDNSISNTPPHYSEQRSGTGLSNGFAQHSLWIASVLHLPKLAPNHFFLFFSHFIYFDVCFENTCNKFVLITREWPSHPSFFKKTDFHFPKHICTF